MAKNNEITQDILGELRPIGSITPKLYGLPKMHKPNIPLRPIISMIKSPQHNLAKFLNILLQPILRFYSRYIVNDSFEVVDRIRNLSSKDTLMSSFDVNKLFTNVPLEKIIQISTVKLCSLEKPKLKEITL